MQSSARGAFPVPVVVDEEERGGVILITHDVQSASHAAYIKWRTMG